MKKFMCIFLICLAVWVANVYWIKSSPVLGQVALSEMMPSEGKRALSEWFSGEDENYQVYSTIYAKRPHQADVLRAGIYKIVAGDTFAIFEVQKLAFMSAAVAIPQENLPFVLSKVRPRAAASEYFDIILPRLISKEIIRWKKEENRDGTFFVTKLLVDAQTVSSLYVTGLLLFENPAEINRVLEGLTSRELIESFAELYRLLIARASFSESVLDESEPDQGILYLLYYPYYNKLWVVVKSVPETSLQNSEIFVDGRNAAGEIVYPFIFVNAELEKGLHKFELRVSDRTYRLDFEVELIPIWIYSPVIAKNENGVHYAVVYNIDHLGRPVTLSTVKITLDGQETSMSLNNLTIGPYEQVMISQLPVPNFTGRNEGKVGIEYTVDGISDTLWFDVLFQG
ncbi:MAG: hypothetical protein QXG10_02605 [Candidatus Hadarchaeales archaeon]